MEIRISFEEGRVADASSWTNGCVHSLNSVYAAADLAKGRTPDELLLVDEVMIRDAVGGLPGSHMHCARLAEETLQAALHDYMMNRRD